MKFAVMTLGCKVNDYEATFTKQQLEQEFIMNLEEHVHNGQVKVT